VARQVRRSAALQGLQDIIASSAWTSFEDDKLAVAGAQDPEVPLPAFHVASSSRLQGVYVPLPETIRGFARSSREARRPAEQAFYMVGTIDDACEKARQMAA